MCAETAIDTKYMDEVKAFSDSIAGATMAAQLMQCAYIGTKLGWYTTLADASNPMTPIELAEATKTSARYAREWLEYQCVCGWIKCTDAENEQDPNQRHFTLPKSHAEVLTNKLSVAYSTPLVTFTGGFGKKMDSLIQAYKTDGGVAWNDLGEDGRGSSAALNRPFFTHELANAISGVLPELTNKFELAGGSVADIGAGYAWSSIAMATHFDKISVDAFDIDAPSIKEANHQIKELKLDNRVTATCTDAAAIDAMEKQYDLVMALQCIHDIAHPVSTLKSMRKLAGNGKGTVIVLDTKVSDMFSGVPDPIEQMMYGFSCMCCLPDSKSDPNSVATGTIMRPSTLRHYAQMAGFKEIEVFDIGHPVLHLYKLI